MILWKYYQKFFDQNVNYCSDVVELRRPGSNQMKESLTSRFVRFDAAEQNHLIKLGLQLDLNWVLIFGLLQVFPFWSTFRIKFFLTVNIYNKLNTSKYLKADVWKGDLQTVLWSTLK